MWGSQQVPQPHDVVYMRTHHLKSISLLLRLIRSVVGTALFWRRELKPNRSKPTSTAAGGGSRSLFSLGPGCSWVSSTSTDFTGHQLKPVRALPNPPFRRPVGFGAGRGLTTNVDCLATHERAPFVVAAWCRRCRVTCRTEATCVCGR